MTEKQAIIIFGILFLVTAMTMVSSISYNSEFNRNKNTELTIEQKQNIENQKEYVQQVTEWAKQFEGVVVDLPNGGTKVYTGRHINSNLYVGDY